MTLAKWAARRPADQVENPYPNVSGFVCTARFISAMNSGVGRLLRPGGLIGRSALIPPVRYSLRMRPTVSGLHPTCWAIVGIVSRESDLRMIRQLRKTSADSVVNRN
ncbi:MAG: hypothetical protein V1790_09195 [Planctomycetota bacterium]